ncbi:MAG: hypothetical protein VW274_09125, partial [Thalassolituus sp.]
MMLARQKSMLATLLVCAGVILIATLAYIAAADRVGRQNVGPELSYMLAKITEAQLASAPDDLHPLQSILFQMTQHYQIQEVAIYNASGQRLGHSNDASAQSVFRSDLRLIEPGTAGERYVFTAGDQEFTLLIRHDVSLPGFFYLDTLTTSLVIVAVSSLLVFMLYLFTR